MGDAREPLDAPQLEDYRVDELIARGGFGAVFSAVRRQDQVPVALKVASKFNVRAHHYLVRETEILSSIGESAAPRVYGSGVIHYSHGDVPYLAMERITMPTLSQLLLDTPAGIETDVFRNGVDAILDALEAVHQSGYIHCDLKPQNIFLARSQQAAKLIDFGISERIAHTGHRSAVSPHADTALLGTYEYMAPEQARGRSAIGVHTDIYSLGIVLYEMLVGRPPFLGTGMQVSEAHISYRPAPPSRFGPVPAKLEPIIMRCLAKQPEERFGAVSELRASLAQAWRDTDSRARAVPAVPVAVPATSSKPHHQLKGVLFFHTRGDIASIKKLLSARDASLVELEGDHYAAVFTLALSGNPIRNVVRAAQALIDSNVVERVLVDSIRVRVRMSRAGHPRFVSSAFWDEQRLPTDAMPTGILATSEAAELSVGLDGVELDALNDTRELFQVSLRRGAVSTSIDLRALGQTSMIGRAEELDRLLASARAAITLRLPTIATVSADIGMGKSHLYSVLAHHLSRELPAAQRIQLRLREPVAGENFSTLRSLLRHALDLPRDAEPASARAQIAHYLDADEAEELAANIALLLDWNQPPTSPARKLAFAPGAIQAAAVRTTGEAIRARAAREPLLCLIDDIHFADENALNALSFATLSETRLPIWICVFARPEFAHLRTTWGQRAHEHVTVRLEPLAAASAAQLCRALLPDGTNIADNVLTQIHARAQGNPLHLVELIRSILRSDLVRRDDRYNTWYVANHELNQVGDLPIMEWLTEREIAGLPAELASHARLMALLGPDIQLDTLRGVLDVLESDGLGALFPMDAGVSCQRLLDHGILVAKLEREFSFRNQLLWTQISRQVPPDLRRQLHAAAYRFYTEAAIPAHVRVPALAQHAEHSGQNDVAERLYRELGERALSGQDYQAAETMYTQAITVGAGTEIRTGLANHRGRGMARLHLGRFQDALADFESARAQAGRCDDPSAVIDLLLQQATALDWLHEYRRSQACVIEARAMATFELSTNLAAELAQARGRAAYRFGDQPEAARLLEEALRLGQQLGESGYQVTVQSLLLLASTLCKQGIFERARAMFDRLVALCQDHQDALHYAAAVNNRRLLWILTQDFDRAIDDASECQRIGRELGHSVFEYVASYNLAELYHQRGRFADAWPLIARVCAMEATSPTPPIGQLMAARIAIFRERLDEARNIVNDIHAEQRRARSEGVEDILFLKPERLLFSIIELVIGDGDDDRWNDLCERANGEVAPMEYAEIFEMRARCAWRTGHFHRALEHISYALELTRQTPLPNEERIHRIHAYYSNEIQRHPHRAG